MKHEKTFLSQNWKPNKTYWEQRHKQKEESRKRFMNRIRGLDFTVMAKYITRKLSWEKE